MALRRELLVGVGVAGALALCALAALSLPAEPESGGSGPRAGASATSDSFGPNLTAPASQGAAASGGSAPSLADRLAASEVSSQDLAGAVVDEQGRPLGGALIRAAASDTPDVDGGKTWRTDAAGRFAFRAPQGARDYILSVEHPPLAGRKVPARPGQPVSVVLSGGGVVSGTCRGPRGEPLAATVRVLAGDWESESRCDDAGRFRIDAVPAGLASVRATASGHLPASGDLEVVSGSERSVDLSLRAGQTLRVRIQGLGPGAKGPGEVRALLRGSDGESISGSADDGELVLLGIPPGEARLILAAPGLSLGPLTVEVPFGADPEPLEALLLPDPVLRGQALSAEGDPLGAEVTVALTPDANGLAWPDAGESVTGRDGFALPALPRGEYQVRLSAEGYAATTFPLALDDDRELNVALTPEAGVRVLVLAADGSPLEDAYVRVAAADGARTARSDAQGRALILGLAPGPVQVQARAPQAAPDGCELILLAGQINDLTVTLSEPRSLRGAVVDESGQPIPGASVLLDDPLLDALTHCDDAGRFVLEALPRGPLRVLASARGHATARAPVDAGQAELRLVLVREHLVTGEVRDPGGTPVDAFAVAPAETPERLTWFRGGRFALVVGSATRELLVRSAPDRHHHGDEAELPPALSPRRVPLGAKGVPLQIVLEAGLEAEGIVLDAEGRPVHGAAFLVGEPLEEELLSEGETNALCMSVEGGVFHVGGLPPQGLTVTVSHPRHAPLRTVLVPGEALRLQLPKASRLLGVVTSEGAPAGGVGLILEGPCVRRGTSGADGRFTFDGLAPGRYVLTRVDSETTLEVDVPAAGDASATLR